MTNTYSGLFRVVIDHVVGVNDLLRYQDDDVDEEENDDDGEEMSILDDLGMYVGSVIT